MLHRDTHPGACRWSEIISDSPSLVPSVLIYYRWPQHEVGQRVEQMGAIYKSDLTTDVTHLIAGDSDTPKYKHVARERPDIIILTLQWVEAVRARWMQGEEIDTRHLEDQFRRPAFADLRISMTGFEEGE